MYLRDRWHRGSTVNLDFGEKVSFQSLDKITYQVIKRDYPYGDIGGGIRFCVSADENTYYYLGFGSNDQLMKLRQVVNGEETVVAAAPDDFESNPWNVVSEISISGNTIQWTLQAQTPGGAMKTWTDSYTDTAGIISGGWRYPVAFFSQGDWGMMMENLKLYGEYSVSPSFTEDFSTYETTPSDELDGNVRVLGTNPSGAKWVTSMIYAVNCGDDTDCTAATVGAFLGILYGTSGIPEDWREYVGDRIVNAALTADCYDLPDSCRKLTERVMLLMPVVFKANGVNMEWTNEESDITYSRELAGADGVSWDMYDRCQCSAISLCSRNPYSFEAFSAVYASGILEMDRAPILKPGETIRLKLRMVNRMVDPRHMYFRLYLPEGWQADEYPKSAFMPYPNQKELAAKGLPQPEFFWEAAVTAGERIERSNRVIIEVSAEGRSVVSLIPVTILG